MIANMPTIIKRLFFNKSLVLLIQFFILHLQLVICSFHNANQHNQHHNKHYHLPQHQLQYYHPHQQEIHPDVEILDQAEITRLAGAGNEVDVSDTSGVGNNGSKCGLYMKKLDRCASDLLAFGHHSAPYPMNEQELSSVYCPNYNKTLQCIKSSSQCLKRFERQVVEWVLGSTRLMNNKRCKNNHNEKAKFLRLTNSCFSRMGSNIDNCMDSYIVSLEAVANLDKFIAKQSENDIQIQLACCANEKFKQCVMESAKSQCKTHESIKRKFRRINSVSSGKTAKKLLSRANNQMMDDMEATLESMKLTGPELICRTLKQDFCAQNFDGKYDIKLRRPRHKSIVPSMLQIYKS